MSAETRVKQLLEAAEWLRTTGDVEGAHHLYLQVLQVEPRNPIAAEALDQLGDLPVAHAASGALRAPVDGASPPSVAPIQVNDASDPLSLIDDGGGWAPSGSGPAFSSTPAVGDVASAQGGAALSEEVQALLGGARDLIGLDDHTGALELIEKARELAPDSVEIRSMRERSEATLLEMLESKLGDQQRVPRVILKPDDVIWLDLDHRAGFVLAQIDGTVTFDELFAVSGMSYLDTARILVQLLDQGVIAA